MLGKEGLWPVETMMKIKIPFFSKTYRIPNPQMFFVSSEQIIFESLDFNFF